MLALWRACKRKHYWSTIVGLYPTGKSVHLVAGAAFAAGCEAARRKVFLSPEPKTVSNSDTLEAAFTAFSREWGDYEPPDNPRNAKTFAGTFAALANYLENYPPATDPVQPLLRSDGTPAVEYRFAIPIDVQHPSGDPFLFVGRFDLLGSYAFGTEAFTVVLDEKTTSSFTAQWADSWDMRGQFIGYVWALQQQSFDIQHVVVRGIAIQKTDFKVQTAFIQYPQHQIDQWANQLLLDVTDIRDTWLAFTRSYGNLDQLYRKNWAGACSSYGGCAFANLCTVASPEAFFSNYIFHRWNPLTLRPVEELASSLVATQ